jgi:hypothetical protein
MDRDGNQRTATVLVASSFEFVPMAKRDGGNTGEAATNDSGGETVANDRDNSDIPF